MRPQSIRTARAAAVALVAIAACSKPAIFPESIDFGRQTLTKATEWNRGGLLGVVYVPPGQVLPSASLQVGAIVSTEHATAAALHYWVDEQSLRSGSMRAHSSGSREDSCTVAVSGGPDKRWYLSLKVCKTGVARSACVEADEALEQRVFEQCVNNSDCFDQVCDDRWLARREALDLFAANVLTTR